MLYAVASAVLLTALVILPLVCWYTAHHRGQDAFLRSEAARRAELRGKHPRGA
jgi:hypothetical protein